MTTPWAEARVEAELDFGNIDEEIRRRLERSVAIATRRCEAHFTALEKHASRTAKQIARGFETAFKQISRDSQRMAALVRADIASASGTIQIGFDDGAARTKIAALKAHLQQQLAATIKIDINQASALQAAGRARNIIQTYFAANPVTISVGVDQSALSALSAPNLNVTIDVNTAASMAALQAAHAQMQGWLSANPLNANVNVDNNSVNSATRSVQRMGRVFGGVGKSVLSAGATLGKWAAIAGTAVVAA